jgi:polysaccharide export outer membrane protein
MLRSLHRRLIRTVTVAAGLALTVGCQTMPDRFGYPICPDAPRELQKVAQPTYRVEPPDILLIDAIRVVPLPPYRINPLDSLLIQVTKSLPAEVILPAIYPVSPEGTVTLGSYYGSVSVADLTIEEAQAAVQNQLRKVVEDTKVSVSLASSRAGQQIRGEHLIRPDGTVSLGLYGSVFVAGLTLEETRAAVEGHLARYLYRPEVSVDVAAYNSKVYYVISDGAGFGEAVTRLPSTGGETVLDALAQVGGLTAVASRGRIWVSRPAPPGCGPDQILPVDWRGITTRGRTATNYQVLPGDRVYVMAQPIIAADTYLGRLVAPVERLFGIVLLGSETVRSVGPQNGTGTGTGSGF